MENISWFKEIKKEDVGSVGGKGANLGEMFNIPLPIPPGFVVTAQAFKQFIESTGIAKQIFPVLNELKAEESEKITQVSEKIKELIIKTKMPQNIEEDIKEAYENLNVDRDVLNSVKGTPLDIIKSGRDPPLVAVRSSATAEDAPTASFAGQQETFLNIKGANNVVSAVQQCWASLYTPRAIYYRIKNNFPHDKVLIAVVVEKMVHSDVSGVMFSINPATNNKNEIMIEAGFGLGDAIVGGEIAPDTYIVDKNSLEIKAKKINIQRWMYDKDGLGGKVKRDITIEKGSRQKITDEGIKKLAEFAKEIEDHYNMPMDIEWAVEGNKLFIVQARPVTTISAISKKEIKEVKGNVLLEGLGASPGIVAGTVKVVHNPKEINKVQKGDILVAVMTSPDFVPAMERAAGIVTDEGGVTAHTAIVSRELGIPCIVGTGNATKVLHDGDIITLDGNSGKVYSGNVQASIYEKPTEEYTSRIETTPRLASTKTKIYMNLGEPEKIDKYKDLPFDGIGLMRIEFIISSWIKAHPLYLIKEGREEEYISKLADGIEKVASAIEDKPIIVRFSDFKSNEYRNLEGGNEFEPHEDNPLIGWRGVSRYISEEFEPAFRLECKAIKRIRDSGFKSVHVMLPFVRNIAEVEKVLGIMQSEGLKRSDDFGVYLMAEIPSFALLAEKFAELDITGCSIGSNDLSMLILGVDRDSGKLGRMGYFDENNEAVKKAIRMIIEGFHKNNKTVSICGQAPSEYPEFTKFLIKAGIDAISLNPDAVAKTRQQVASIENIHKL